MTIRKVVATIAVGALLIIELACAGKQPRVNKKCDCGHSNEFVVADRIVGGTPVAPHIFPWIVAIFDRGLLHCGGALLNDRYILTAGHCIDGMDKINITIGIGMHDVQKTKDAAILPVSRLIAHENFSSDKVHDIHDIALIRLKHRVKFTDNIQPICLPHKNSDYTGHEVKVSGWGRIKSNGGSSRYLRQATLKVMPYETCKLSKLGSHIDKTVMCAYADNTDACQGDSGGPLLYQRETNKYETIGVVSWGMGCAQKGYPGVYVRNTHYLDWIYSHTADSTYCMDK